MLKELAVMVGFCVREEYNFPTTTPNKLWKSYSCGFGNSHLISKRYPLWAIAH